MAYTQAPDGTWLDDDGAPVRSNNGPTDAGAPMDAALPGPPAPIPSSPFHLPAGLPNRTPKSQIAPTTVAPAVQPPLLPSPVVPSAKLEKTSSSTTSTRATKEEKAAAGKVQSTGGEVVKAIQGQADHSQADALADKQMGVDQKHAEAALNQANAEKLNAENKEKERVALQEKQDAAVAAARQASDDELKKYQGMKIQDFYADKTEGQKTRMLLGIAISGIGNAISGGKQGNMAEQTLDKMMDQFYANQKAAIDKQFKTYEITHGREAGVERARQEAYVHLDHKYAGLLDAVAKEAAVKKAQTGADEATIARDATVNKYDQAAKAKAVEAAQKAEELAVTELHRTEGLRSQSTTTHSLTDPTLAMGGAAGSLSPAQATVAGQIQQLLSSLDNVSAGTKLSPKDLDRIQENETSMRAADQAHGFTGNAAALISRKAGLVAKSATDGLDAPRAKTYQEYLVIRETVGNIISGLNLPEDQARRIALMVTPQPGEPPATWKAKAARVISFAQNRVIQTGAAGPMLNQQIAGAQQRLDTAGAEPAPRPAAPSGGLPPGAVAGTMGGKRGYKLGGQFYVTEMAQQ